jgi:hypothetical protein
MREVLAREWVELVDLFVQLVRYASYSDGDMSLRSQRDVSGQCRVCNKNASYKPINRDLPRDIQIFFQSPWTLVEKQCKQLQAVMKFQAEQQARFCNNVLTKVGVVYSGAIR